MNVRLDEWSALALLLERGIPLEDALSLAFRDSDPYQKRLRQGESCFIDAGGPRNSFERTLSCFLKAAGMASAIRMSVRLCTIRQRLLRQLFKQASYPIVLLVMAFVLVLFFLSSIFPQLQQLSDTSSSSAALLLLQLLRLLFLLILCLLVLLLALSVFLWRQKDVRRICILRFHSRLPLLQNMISYLFAAYLHELMTAGLSTRQAFAFLEQLEEESMLHSCIIEVRRLLEQGSHMSRSSRPLRISLLVSVVFFSSVIEVRPCLRRSRCFANRNWNVGRNSLHGAGGSCNCAYMR